MNVLMITQSYPPVMGSHVQRVVQIVNGLISEGNDVHLITGEILKSHPSYDESTFDLINDRVHIYRVPIGFVHKRAYTSFNNEIQVAYNKKTKSSSKIKKFIFSLVNNIKNDIFFPDSMIDWANPVHKYVNESKIIQKVQPDIILSCCMPPSIHLICSKIAKKNQIPLYLDYADPWTYLGDWKTKKNTFRFKRARNLEKRIINQSIGFSFSAPGCQELYIEKFGISREKTISVVSGFSNKLEKHVESCSKEVINKSKLIFTYGGALQKGVRDPLPFFKVGKQFEDMIDVTIRTDRLDIIFSMLNEAGTAKCFHILPYISFDKYFDEMLNSDVLVFFGNNNNVQLPGKIFNNIVTGKHILYIKNTSTPNDSVEEILKNYPNCTIVNNNEIEIKAGLERIINNKSIICQKVDFERIKEWGEEEQIKKLSNHMKEMVGEVYE